MKYKLPVPLYFGPLLTFKLLIPIRMLFAHKESVEKICSNHEANLSAGAVPHTHARRRVKSSHYCN